MAGSSEGATDRMAHIDKLFMGATFHPMPRTLFEATTLSPRVTELVCTAHAWDSITFRCSLTAIRHFMIRKLVSQSFLN